MDLRHKRREKSRTAIVGALERLQRGDGTHPRHAGLRVRLTKQAVAREAGISSATLYRFPDLLKQIELAEDPSKLQRLRPAEQFRRQLVEKISEKDRQIASLLAENLRLSTILAHYDKTLGLKDPIDLKEYRKQNSKRRRDIGDSLSDMTR